MKSDHKQTSYHLSFVFMLALMLIYGIGEVFYSLALKHGEHKWLTVVLGLLSFYAGFLLGNILLVVADLSWGIDYTFRLDLYSVPFGVLACLFFYRFLDRRWSNAKEIFDDSDILDRDV